MSMDAQGDMIVEVMSSQGSRIPQVERKGGSMTTNASHQTITHP